MLGLTERLESAKDQIRGCYNALAERLESPEALIVDYYDASSTRATYCGQLLRAFIAIPPSIVPATAVALLLSSLISIVGATGPVTNVDTAGSVLIFLYLYEGVWSDFAPEKIKTRLSSKGVE